MNIEGEGEEGEEGEVEKEEECVCVGVTEGATKPSTPRKTVD